MKISQADALSLLSKYAEERTPVLATLVTPSLSVARVTAVIRISTDEDILQVLVGESNQIKFRLSEDCVFEYGDFRGEHDAQRFAAFLVIVSSKGDTLSLFETRT